MFAAQCRPNRFGLLLLGALMMLMAAPVLAVWKDPIGLTNFDPDLQPTSLSLSYTLGSGPSGWDVLSIVGSNSGNSTTGTWDGINGGTGLFTSLSFELTAYLSGSGSVFEGGTLDIVNVGPVFDTGGLNPDLTTIGNGAVLLSGTIYNFGVDIADGGDSGTFEFQVSNVQSDVREILQWYDANRGQVIFGSDIITTSGWETGATAFSVTGRADTSVPLPPTLALLAFGMIGIRMLRR